MTEEIWYQRFKTGILKEIPITEAGDVRIGQTENLKAATGCTVVISEKGMRAGVDIRGGGPASRETPLLDPLMAAQKIHAVLLSGGSAFGLGAANGVMSFLEEKGIGLSVGPLTVPLVVQSDIFDLGIGDSRVRPDAVMGYEAAKRALNAPNYRDGNYGAGCGATVGKTGGHDTCMKTGIGSFAVKAGELTVGALVAVNAIGDIFDWKTGRQVAGCLTEDKKGFRNSSDLMLLRLAAPERSMAENTTLGIIITNGYFTKDRLSKIAGMAHDGFARAIHPVHTSGDGDCIYALSTGDVPANPDVVGTLASEVMSEAILRAVYSAESAYGCTAAKDLSFLSE